MSSTIDRAVLLYQQSRFDLAEAELRRVLAEQPNLPGAHALLGLCLSKREEFAEAMQEIEQAIVLSPDWAYPHYCRSMVLEARNRFVEAEESAREALRLEPDDPDNYARVAATLFQQRKWQATLDTALEGLQYDGEHAGCGHLRTMALTKLGRQQDAVQSVDEALRRNPQDDVAHTNKGWALLHEGKPQQAAEHFREALRIDPTYQYAQAGMVEALKAKHFIYRWMLAYFLWMSRLDRRVQWGLVLGGYFGQKFLMDLARKNPAAAPFIWPVVIAYVIFVVLTWFAVPAFNLLLYFNRFGRYALSKDQKSGALAFAICLGIAILGLGVFFIAPWPWHYAGVVPAFAAIGCALPLTMVFHCDRGWPRRAMTIYAATMVVMGITMVVVPWMGVKVVAKIAPIFFIGFLLTPWVANFLMSQTVKK